VADRLQSLEYLARSARSSAGDPTFRQPAVRSVTSLTGADVAAYDRRAHRPGLATIVVIGTVTPAAAPLTRRDASRNSPARKMRNLLSFE